MLNLYQSKNLGVTYKIIERFDNLIAAKEYLAENSYKIEKSRWFIEDRHGRMLLVCPVFEDVAKIIHQFGISEDPYLKIYLQQRRLKI
jgi:hypothetical protein